VQHRSLARRFGRRPGRVRGRATAVRHARSGAGREVVPKGTPGGRGRNGTAPALADVSAMSAGTSARPKKRRLALRLFLTLLVLCWCVFPPSVGGPAGLVHASDVPVSDRYDAPRAEPTGSP